MHRVNIPFLIEEIVFLGTPFNLILLVEPLHCSTRSFLQSLQKLIHFSLILHLLRFFLPLIEMSLHLLLSLRLQAFGASLQCL